jgi:Leucine-rich repeat (LRR) protein
MISDKNLNDISWIANLPNLKLFSIQNESITDFTPLAKINLDLLRLIYMKEHVDAAMFSSAVSLTSLTLRHLDSSSNLQAVGSLVNLTYLELYNLKDVVLDMGHYSKITGLKKLRLNDSQVTNFDAIAALANLEELDLEKTQGVTSLAVLKNLPNLKRLTVSKEVFSDAELSGFGEAVKINQR